VHGDLNQEQRERAMAAFKAGKRDILIATDVAARGIDVDDVTHVINHTIPEDEKTYLHRVGRTGRAGKTGIAVTFVDWDDLHKWALINRALEFGQPEPTETYSSSPHLFADLDIPAGTKGRLKPAAEVARPPRSATASGQSGSGRGSSDRNGSDRSGSDRSRGGDSARGEGGSSRPPRTRNRRRGEGTGAESEAVTSGAPTSQTADAAPTDAAASTSSEQAPAAAGTHDGQGTEHHDGNSAPRRRNRSRRRGPKPE
jgi:superfamily II DNA/RNA helicase